MYNPYNNFYGNPMDKIDNQIRELQNLKKNYQSQPQTAPITQNFQLAPSQNTGGIKYVNSIEEVKNELVFNDTLFINKECTLLWFKNASGDVKTYELKEIIEMDEKDRKIAELEAKINMLVKEKENEQYVNENANGTITIKKPSNGKSNKSSNE